MKAVLKVSRSLPGADAVCDGSAGDRTPNDDDDRLHLLVE